VDEADIGDRKFLISALYGQKSFGNDETGILPQNAKSVRAAARQGGKENKNQLPGIDSEIQYVKAT